MKTSLKQWKHECLLWPLNVTRKCCIMYNVIHLFKNPDATFGEFWEVNKQFSLPVVNDSPHVIPGRGQGSFTGWGCWRMEVWLYVPSALAYRGPTRRTACTWHTSETWNKQGPNIQTFTISDISENIDIHVKVQWTTYKVEYGTMCYLMNTWYCYTLRIAYCKIGINEPRCKSYSSYSSRKYIFCLNYLSYNNCRYIRQYGYHVTLNNLSFTVAETLQMLFLCMTTDHMNFVTIIDQ